MPYTEWMSLGSILFGLIALMIPIIGIVSNQKLRIKETRIFTFLSLSACGISLFLQIFSAEIMVRFEDFSGLIDTIDVVVVISGALLLLTIILNLIDIMLFGKKRK